MLDGLITIGLFTVAIVIIWVLTGNCDGSGGTGNGRYA